MGDGRRIQLRIVIIIVVERIVEQFRRWIVRRRRRLWKMVGTRTLAAGAVCAVLVLGACAYTPAGRERAHADETLRGMQELQQVSVRCEGALLASDALCADVVTTEGKSLRFERVGFKAFGPNASHVVVAEADGWVPRVASCAGVAAPNFHREAPLGHHFGPTLIDLKDAVTRSREVLEEVQFWPQCPQSWEVQDKFGANYRYCAHRKGAPADPPRPGNCPATD